MISAISDSKSQPWACYQRDVLSVRNVSLPPWQHDRYEGLLVAQATSFTNQHDMVDVGAAVDPAVCCGRAM